MSRFVPKHSTVVAYLALIVALGGTATAMTTGSRSVPNQGHFFNSGLLKLNNGGSKIVATRGPLQFKAKCTNAGSGSSSAELKVKNTGNKKAVLESDYNSEYGDPILDPNESREALYSTSNSTPYFFGDYYNLFAVSTHNLAVTGMGSIGTKTMGADCIFQLVLVG